MSSVVTHTNDFISILVVSSSSPLENKHTMCFICRALALSLHNLMSQRWGYRSYVCAKGMEMHCPHVCTHMHTCMHTQWSSEKPKYINHIIINPGWESCSPSYFVELQHNSVLTSIAREGGWWELKSNNVWWTKYSQPYATHTTHQNDWDQNFKMNILKSYFVEDCPMYRMPVGRSNAINHKND